MTDQRPCAESDSCRKRGRCSPSAVATDRVPDIYFASRTALLADPSVVADAGIWSQPVPLVDPRAFVVANEHSNVRICVALSSESCRASDDCRRDGLCRASEGECERGPIPAPESGEFAEPRVANRDGLHGLLASLKDVEQIELLRWDPREKPELLEPADRLRLLQLMRGASLIDARTVAHPPWPAAFLFHTRRHGTYAAILVGPSNLRLDSGRSDGHFEGPAARWNRSTPPEMALNDEDRWLWAYLESRLGVTREKEYLMAKAPDYLELPQKP